MSTFQVWDDAGRLAVDASMITHFCRKSGSGTTGGPFGATGASYVEVDLTGYTRPIVAIVINGGHSAATDSIGLVSGVYKARIVTSAPPGTAYTYYVFDHAPTIASPNGLLQLWDEAGNLTFDSGQWAMKGVDIKQMPDDNLDTFTMSGRSLAVGLGAPGGHYFIVSAECHDGIPTPDLTGCASVWTQMDGKRYGGAVYNSGQTFEAAFVSIDDAGGIIGDEAAYNAFVPWYTPNQVMVIDVTDIPLNTTFF